MKGHRSFHAILLAAALIVLAPATSHAQGELCEGYGPQTPRDIADPAGESPVTFSVAPAAPEMNLCNIHFHKNAEHRGPGFSDFAGEGDFGGYRCNGTAREEDAGAICGNVHVGDTVEVHWVFTTCDVEPGEGLGSCLSDACANPQLRVETQVFNVVGDSDGGQDFGRYTLAPEPVDGFHQPREVPTATGEAVVFLGSTTGPSYDASSKCSPLQVTWSVRPQCAPVSAESLAAWCGANPFAETKAHGVRALVTDPTLLSPIR